MEFAKNVSNIVESGVGYCCCAHWSSLSLACCSCNDVVTRTIVTGPLVAGPRSRDHLPIQPKSLRYDPARYIPTVGTSLLSIHPCCRYSPESLGFQKQPNEGSPVWLCAKGTSRISPSRGHGGGLPWMRGSDLYKEATSLFEATLSGGEMHGLLDATSLALFVF